MTVRHTLKRKRAEAEDTIKATTSELKDKIAAARLARTEKG